MRTQTIIRLLSLPLGLASALLLAMKGLDFSLTDFLEQVLHRFDSVLTDVLKNLFPIDAIYRWLGEVLPIQLPELQPHWKHIFVLLWLFFSAYARATASEERPVRTVFQYAWGGVSALMAGLLAGTATYVDAPVLLWPAAGFALFLAGNFLWDMLFTKSGAHWSQVWLSFASFVLAVAAMVAAAYFALNSSYDVNKPFWDAAGELRSPGLAALASAVALLGVLLLIFGLPGRNGATGSFWQRQQDNPGRRMGLEMLSIFAGAAIVLGSANVANYLFRPLASKSIQIGEDVFSECAMVDEKPFCLNMVKVHGGPFTADEDGVNRQTIVKDFWLSETEITNEQFAVFVEAQNGRKSSSTQCPWDDLKKPELKNYPANCISWSDAVAFARWLSKKSGRNYRLPAAAEWQFAASEGPSFKLPWGENDCDAYKFGNFYGSSRECNDGYAQAAPVKQFSMNGKKLYDMFGNVWEWTEDCDVVNAATADRSPFWSPLKLLGSACLRAVRGGSWSIYPGYARIADRDTRGDIATNGGYDVGFRLARTD